MKQILGQIETKRAREMEIPGRATLASADSSTPSSNTGTAACAHFGRQALPFCFKQDCECAVELAQHCQLRTKAAGVVLMLHVGDAYAVSTKEAWRTCMIMLEFAKVC